MPPCVLGDFSSCVYKTPVGVSNQHVIPLPHPAGEGFALKLQVIGQGEGDGDLARRSLRSVVPLAGSYIPFAEAAREVALELISPTRCAGCERAGALICDGCLASLGLIDPARCCSRCAAPFGSLLCTECAPDAGAAAQMAEALDRCLACAVYEPPLPRIIKAYKDGGERRLAPLIAECLYDCALNAQVADPGRYAGILDEADAVTFVPATAAAYRRRGFDHMEQVARAFCDLSGLPSADVLVKGGSSDQRALGREERQAKARGAYEVIADVRSMRLLLLDDVITTGATMAASATALRRAGAAHIDALALARVW